MLKEEAARGRADDPADLPGDARGGDVAADELRRREVDAERSVDRAVQALADREHKHCGGEDPEGLRGLRPRSGGPDGEHRPAHSTPMSARPRIRLRPSESFTTGSWNRATPSASSANTMPTSFSLIPVTFLPNAGSSSTTSEIAAVMNAALRVCRA